ncbi:MAG: DUF2723 domain-containing protein [Crocinitomicaceae bacterium]|nr:DUF2723 domain-containing protein [Crocinitomicaceae bacterium]
MNYRKINTYLGWSVFLIATIVYFLTIEDTVSLWDCGEYITAAYKLEVGHPPGAPLFMVLGRLFSFFADGENAAVWINRLSGLSSSLTILFMFWSLTMLIKKMILKTRSVLSKGDMIAVFGGAAIGSLAYAFTESFWFSAVEGEVYAMSSLFTAAIFWAILRWDEEMGLVARGMRVKGYSPDRWLLLIMFMLGLAVGVHLLGILVVPAIAFVIYFRFSKKVTLGGIVLTGLLSIVVLGFIQKAVISGTIALASSFEIAFVNSLGLPFYSGTIFFFLFIVAVSVLVLRFARKRGFRILYTSVMGLVLLIVGFGSFAVIVIRSNANTPLDENDPENLVTLQAYLEREQYGSAPILFGQYWNSKENDRNLYDDLGPTYLRRFVVQKSDADIKAFQDEARAKEYAKSITGSVVNEKYYLSNARIREKAVATYAQTTFLPRMYWSNGSDGKVSGYKNWSGYDPKVDKGTEKGSDGNRLPTFGENMTYMANYQISFMYWRYFMWNFAGRQNDIQGHGSAMRGNWKSGFGVIDDARLGSQEAAPYYTQENPSNNAFFLLPLILGLIGLIFHFYKAPKDAFVVFLAFLFTGLAIVIYLNQKPFEPRERDYAYAGSFYFFALWIGIGVYALYEAFKSFGKKELARMGIIAGAGLLLFLIMDASGGGMVRTMSWLIIAVISAIGIGIMMLLSKVLKKDEHGAGAAILLTIAIPLILGFQGWDDHDRSMKTSARDLAMNYLKSCEDNGIIFTNGDNDTFPLWYMQEVEGYKTSVRVCNLSLMQTDWYTDQMKMKAYESEGLPIKFTEDQILMYAGNTDQVYFFDLIQLFQRAPSALTKKVIALRANGSPNEAKAALGQLARTAQSIMAGVTTTDAKTRARLDKIRGIISGPPKENLADDIYERYSACLEVLMASQNSDAVKMSQKSAQSLQDLLLNFEKSWDFSNLQEAMAFTRDDDNLLDMEGQSVRIFPSSGFVLPVNFKNAVKSGLITKDQKDECVSELRFNFDKQYITREQTMMLDIMANNDWKRGLYFSSPGGSEVALALYRRGYVKQNGMAFEVSPLNRPNERTNMERMYENLMKNYSYGEMQNPDVLTDYYTRRHTKQYRAHFYSLADEYLNKIYDAQRRGVEMPEAEVKECEKRVIALLKKSLKEMPADVVIDYGEPSRSRDPRDGYPQLDGAGGILKDETGQEVKLKGFVDGELHNYVTLFYEAGDVKAAEKLGNTVAGQLESIINYFDQSDAEFLTDPRNREDFLSAMHAYYVLNTSAINAGQEKNKLATRTSKKLKYYNKEMYPRLIKALKDRAKENGESLNSSNGGDNSNAMRVLEDYQMGMGMQFGYFPKPDASNMTLPQSQGGQEMPSMEEIEAMLKAQNPTQDSTLP